MALIRLLHGLGGIIEPYRLNCGSHLVPVSITETNKKLPQKHVNSTFSDFQRIIHFLIVIIALKNLIAAMLMACDFKTQCLSIRRGPYKAHKGLIRALQGP